MDISEAEANLRLIRTMMERATRWTGLPAYACFGAAACGIAGYAYCHARGLTFGNPAHAAPLLEAWFTVAAIAAVQIVAFTVMAARSKGLPAISGATRSIVFSMIPGLFTGGILTNVLPLDQRPGVWMLCYGTALLGMGLFAGWKANLVGSLFLAAGTLSLLVLTSYGLLMMAVAFGGLHALLGCLLLIRPREVHESPGVDEG